MNIIIELVLALVLSVFPACVEEDSALCYWDASTQGNGVGTSFISLGEVIIPLP